MEDPDYRARRRKSLAGLDRDTIDRPITALIDGFNRLPCCFTLQSCCGHFLYDGQADPRNTAPLPLTTAIADVTYRIAYLALCIENSATGRRLLAALQRLAHIDPENTQCGCAQWFWDRQVNSYVLQVEPDRFKHLDTAVLGYQEALKIERLRNDVFERLASLPPSLFCLSLL